jgi:hypothetical protein
MNHLKKFEALFDTDEATKDLRKDTKKTRELYGRKIKHATDYVSKFFNNKPTIDREYVPFDKKLMMKDIQKAIKNFSRLESFFGKYRTSHVAGSFSDFLYQYKELIDKYGFYPTNITKELINDLWQTQYSMGGTYLSRIATEKESDDLYKEQEKLLQKISNQYNEFENTIKNYNL